MKKRLISLIVISTLSLSLLVGCMDNKESANDTPPNINVEDTTDSNNETKENDTPEDRNTEDTKNEDTDNTDTIANNDGVTSASLIEESFTNALNELYNSDYSHKENKDLAKEYVRSKFS